MPDTSTDAFLSGQGIPVDLREIETELTTALGAGGRAGRRTRPGERPTSPGSSWRTSSSTAGRPTRRGSQQVLDTVTEQLPVPDDRALPDRRARPHRSPPRSRRSATCPRPACRRSASERIVLRAGPEAVDLLPGAVRPLLEADLPFVLWWTDDPRNDEALFRDLADECSRLILDLPDPGADPAAVRLGLDLDDQPLQPRHRLVRPDPLARAGRAVLRLPRHRRDPGSDRLGPDRGRLAHRQDPAPARALARGLARRSARLDPARATPGGRLAASRPPSRVPRAWSPSRSRPRPSRRSPSRSSAPSP